MKNSARIIIRHKADECIGCCACAEVIPQYFQMDEDGMAVLSGGQKQRLVLKATALAMDLDDIETAVEDCPVNIIRVDPT
jgi:ferredoxin